MAPIVSKQRHLNVFSRFGNSHIGQIEEPGAYLMSPLKYKVSYYNPEGVRLTQLEHLNGVTIRVCVYITITETK